MPIDDLLKRIDEQIAEQRAQQSKPPGDRRQLQDRRAVQQPVTEDRRTLDRRVKQDRRAARRGPPRREDFKDGEAYDKAYDRWAENQR
jgi:hypothetical protein